MFTFFISSPHSTYRYSFGKPLHIYYTIAVHISHQFRKRKNHRTLYFKISVKYKKNCADSYLYADCLYLKNFNTPGGPWQTNRTPCYNKHLLTKLVCARASLRRRRGRVSLLLPRGGKLARVRLLYFISTFSLHL